MQTNIFCDKIVGGFELNIVEEILSRHHGSSTAATAETTANKITGCG